MTFKIKNIAGILLLSVIVTYLTVFIEYRMPPTPPYTAEYHSAKVLVGGLPYYFLEDNEGVSPVNTLDSNPLMWVTGIDIFHLSRFLIDCGFWLAIILIGMGLWYAIQRNKLNIKASADS